MSDRGLARIGMVNFINTAPIYEIWKKKSYPKEWQVVEAPPAMLNQLLAAGELDLGFVSSYEYGIHPESYRILDNLSISANGSVGSVFLFSRIDPKLLGGELVLLSGQSDTSVALVKIILEEFYQVRPRYFRGAVRGREQADCKAVMAIGDEALRLVGSLEFPFQLDLGEVWCRNTRLPFVFAVCAVREAFVRDHPQTVQAIHQAFLNCRREGSEQLESICQLVAPRIPMHPDECYVYLRAIEHDLGMRKKLSLEHFFQILIKRGEASEKALPLKIVSFPENG